MELIDINKSYIEGSRRLMILSGVHASIAEGKLSVILGRSGSGKSTLLNLIAGIDTADSGQIIIDGIDITSLSDYERTIFRRRRIGFIFQFFNLIPTLTVLENTMLIRELDGASSKEQKDDATRILDSVGLANRLSAKPENLSGGEQQRVAIARALAHDPDLILADEPTGNLDHDTGREVLDLLVSLTRRHGKSLIMATHSREALSYADHVFRIENGLLVPESMHQDKDVG